MRWEVAKSTAGADSFGVDYAVACMTDASSATAVRETPELLARLTTHVMGPPWCGLLEAGGRCCDIAWFGSGTGDGQYTAYYGWVEGDEQPGALLIPF